MKNENISENIARYQLLTDKYKAKKNRSKPKTGSVAFSAVPYRSLSLLRGRSRHTSRDIRAYESDNEVNYKCERDYLGVPNVGGNGFVEVEHAQEGQSKSRGRLQLRLKKVKEYQADFAVETFSEYSVRAQKKWTSCDSSSRKDKDHFIQQRCSKANNGDLLCVYDVTDSEIDYENSGQNILLVKKYQTKEHADKTFERLVRPSRRLNTQSKQKVDNSRGSYRSYSSDCESIRCAEDENTNKYNDSGRDPSRCRERRKSKNKGRQSKWTRSNECQNMSVSESETEFEVEEKQDLCKKFRRLRSRHAISRSQKLSTKYSKSKVLTNEVYESESEASEELEHSEDDVRMFECEFCKKLFSSDEALDNHYMTHFTTLQGLNTFLNKRHAQKYSESKEVCSSILKDSGSYRSDVKKKVVFEIDVDEGVDCRSPGRNSCEVIDLLPHETNLSEGEEENNYTANKIKEMPRKEEVKKEVSENHTELEVKVPNSCEQTCLAGRKKSDRFLVSIGSENLYCSHNVDLVKSCVNRVVKVQLSPSKIEKNKLSDRKRMGCKQIKHSVNDLWSVAKNSVKGKSRKKGESRNYTKRKKGKKGSGKGSLKMTLSKKLNSWKKGIEMVYKATEVVQSEENASKFNTKFPRGNKNKSGDVNRNKKIEVEGNVSRNRKKEFNRSLENLHQVGQKMNLNVCSSSLEKSVPKVSPRKRNERSQNKMTASGVNKLGNNVGKKCPGKTKAVEREKDLNEHAGKKKTRKKKAGEREKDLAADVSKKNLRKIEARIWDNDLAVEKQQGNEDENTNRTTRSVKQCKSFSIIDATESHICSKRNMNVPSSENISKRLRSVKHTSNSDNPDTKKIRRKACPHRASLSMEYTQNVLSRHSNNLTESEKKSDDRGMKSIKLRINQDEKDIALNSDSDRNSQQMLKSKITCSSEKLSGSELKHSKKKNKKGKRKVGKQKELCELVSTNRSDQNDEKSKGKLNLSGNICKTLCKKYKKRGKCKNLDGALKIRTKVKKMPISKEFVSSSEQSDTEDELNRKVEEDTGTVNNKQRDGNVVLGCGKDLVYSEKIVKEEMRKGLHGRAEDDSGSADKPIDDKVILGSDRDLVYSEKTKKEEITEGLNRKVEVQGKLEKMQAYVVSKKDYFAKFDTENTGRMEWYNTDNDVDTELTEELLNRKGESKQMDFHLKNNIFDDSKVGSENGSISFIRNDSELWESETVDDERIHDSCCDEILIEFVSDFDILLNSPDASLMFDESALYNNMENLNLDLSKDEDATAIENHCTDTIVENTDKSSAMLPKEVKEPESDHQSQLCNHKAGSIKKSRIDYGEETEDTFETLSGMDLSESPDAISACIAITGLPPKEQNPESEISIHHSHVDETRKKSDTKKKIEQHDVQTKKFKTEANLGHNRNCEADTVSEFDEKPDVEIQSKIIKMSRKEAAAERDAEDLSQYVKTEEREIMTLINHTEKVEGGHLGDCGRARGSHKEVNEAQFKRRQPILNSEYKKGTKFNFEKKVDQSKDNVLIVEMEKQSMNSENTDIKHFANLEESLSKRNEHVQTELDIRISTKSEGQEKQNVNSQVMKSHSKDMLNVFDETQKQTSSSKYNKRKLKHSFQTHKHRKIEKIEDVNNNDLYEFIDLTKSKETTDLQDSDKAILKNQDRLSKTCIECPGMYKDIVEKTKCDIPLNKFYRCEKCNKLFHAVAPLDFNNCKSCNEILFKNRSSSNSYKRFTNTKPNDRVDRIKKKGDLLEPVKTAELKADVEIDTVKSASVTSIVNADHAADNETRGTEENLKEKKPGSSGPTVEHQVLKLVLQKMKSPNRSLDSNTCEFTGSPEQPLWRVTDFVTSDTQVKDVHEYPNVDDCSKGSSVETNDFDAMYTQNEQISESLKIENSGSQKKEKYAESLEHMKEKKTENSDLSRSFKAEKCKNEIHKKHRNVKNLVMTGKSAISECKDRRENHTKIKIDFQEQLNEFEKALLKGYETKKKDKLKKRDKTKEKKKIGSGQNYEKSYIEDNKRLLFKCRSYRSLTNSESGQPFQKSKIAQMIYNKHQRENLDTSDGLPDFSATKVDLGSLQPLSVSSKGSNKDIDSCSKISDDSSYSGVSALTETRSPVMAGITSVPAVPPFSTASVTVNSKNDVETAVTCTQNKMSRISSALGSFESTFSTTSGSSLITAEAGLNNYKSVNGFQNVKTNILNTVVENPKVGKKDAKDFQELKKELEAIGITKDVKLKDQIGSAMFSSEFSQTLNRQKNNLFMSNSQVVLPSFSDTFSKKKVLPSTKIQTFSGFTKFNKISETSESDKTSETESDFNDEDEESVFEELNESKLEVVPKSPEHHIVFDMLGKRKLSEGSEGAVLPFQGSAEFQASVNHLSPPASHMRSEFNETKLDRNPINFSSTPAVKGSSWNSMSTVQCPDLNISQISMCSSVPEETSGIARPKRRRIKRLEIQEYQSEGTNVHQNANSLQNSHMSSMLILSADCSKIDMSGLSGPSVDITAEHSQHDNSGLPGPSVDMTAEHSQHDNSGLPGPSVDMTAEHSQHDNSGLSGPSVDMTAQHSQHDNSGLSGPSVDMTTEHSQHDNFGLSGPSVDMTAEHSQHDNSGLSGPSVDKTTEHSQHDNSGLSGPSVDMTTEHSQHDSSGLSGPSVDMTAEHSQHDNSGLSGPSVDMTTEHSQHDNSGLSGPSVDMTAEHSQHDNSGLSGPSVDMTTEHSQHDNSGHKDYFEQEPCVTQDFQTIKTEDDITDRKQMQKVDELDGNNTQAEDELQEKVESDARIENESLLDYEDDHCYDSLFSADSCDNTVIANTVKENSLEIGFATTDSSERIIENPGSDKPLRIVKRSKEGKKLDKGMYSCKVDIDNGEEAKDVNCSRRVLRKQSEEENVCELDIDSTHSAFSKSGEVKDKLDSIQGKQGNSKQDQEIHVFSKNVLENKNSKTNTSDEKCEIDTDLEGKQSNRNAGTNIEENHFMKGSKVVCQSDDYDDNDGILDTDADQEVIGEVTEKDDEDDGDEEVMDDVLELYASDEECEFLFDSPLPNLPSNSQTAVPPAVKIEDNYEVEDMVLETGSSASESPAVQTELPVTAQEFKLQQQLPVFRPMQSNPIKGRWMPRGWCFRYFSRMACSQQCMFRHDNPTQDVLRRCMSEVTEKCKKGELDSAMNMLMSQQYFMENISADNLDCLYGYSVNHLKLEYCHTLLQLISCRGLIKQGHIDDAIFLWKRLGYSKDVEALKGAFFIAKQKNIFPQYRAILVLLEAFSAYGDMYMLWDVIIYCRQNQDLVISQQYVNKAMSLVASCQDMSLLSAAVTWLETVTADQLAHINNEVLHRLRNALQRMNLVKLLSPVHQCLLRKRQVASEQQGVPSDAGQESVPSDAGQQIVPSDSGQQSLPSGAGQQRVPSGAGQQSIPSRVEQQRVPSGAGQQSVPSGVGQQRVPSGAEQQRVSSGADQQRVPSGTGQQSIPSGVGQQSGPSGTRLQRVPSDAGQQRVPSGAGQQRGPSGVGQQSVPSGAGQQIVPSGTRLQRVPSGIGQQSVPNGAVQQRKPSGTGLQREPSVAGQQRVSRGIGQQSVPSGTRQQSVPSDIGQLSVPRCVGQQRVPSGVGQQSVPSGVGQQRVPSGVGQQRVPSGVGQQRVPSGVGQQNVPSGVGQQRVPSGVGQQSVPSLTGQLNVPISSVQQCIPRGTEQQGELSGAGQQCVPSARRQSVPSVTGQRNVSKLPDQLLPHTANYKTSVCDSNAFSQQGVSQLCSTRIPSRAATPSNLDSVDSGQYSGQNRVPYTVTPLKQSNKVNVKHHDSDWVRLARQQNLPQCHNVGLLFRAQNDPNRRVIQQELPRAANAPNCRYQKKPQLGHAQSRAITLTDNDTTNLGVGTYKEPPFSDRTLLEQLKVASESSNWQSLADLFICCCQRGPPPPQVFEQVLFGLTKDDSSVGKAWKDFIMYITQKKQENPGLILNKNSLSVLGSEVFYACYQRGSTDTKDILLVILDTNFLTLSLSVGHRWNICLELVAAEFLADAGMPEKAAEILLEISPRQWFEAEVKTRFQSFLQPLILQLCTQGSYSLVFQIFCIAFKGKYRGLRVIASELIQCCLQTEVLEIPVQVYELYITDGRPFDIWEMVKRSLLNALVNTNMEYSERLYQEIIQNTSTGLYLQQSYEKPRCIWLQSFHTYNEIKLIVEKYLRDLYNVLCDQVDKNVPLMVQDLSLDVAVDTQTSHTNQQEMPYVGPGRASLSNIKQLLSAEFGIESELSRRGIIKLSVQQASLEMYLKNLDQQGCMLGLDFGRSMLPQSTKIKITRK